MIDPKYMSVSKDNKCVAFSNSAERSMELVNADIAIPVHDFNEKLDIAIFHQSGQMVIIDHTKKEGE